MAKAKKEEVEKSKLQESIDALNGKYGKGTVLTLNEKEEGTYEVISTGSISFDYYTLGVGGFVLGKLYELMGWEGTGKSTICGHAAAECQKKGGKVLYIDSEHALDKNYFQKLGVNVDEMIISQPDYGEQGFNIAMEMIKSGEIQLVIIDSDNGLLPKKIIDGEIGDSALGKKAVLNNNAYPKLKGALAENNVCVIVISQYREKIGVMFGSPITTQGGHALKFYTDGRIEVSKSLAKEGEEVYGNTTKVRCTKNKMTSPYRSSQFDVVYGKGIDKIKEIIELASDYELIRKWGKQVTWNDTKYELSLFTEMLEDNQEFFDSLKEEIIIKIREDANQVEKVTEGSAVASEG